MEWFQLAGALALTCILSVIVIAPLAALFSYSAARRVETTNTLRRTRAELARAAAAEERLRIARDLHDLLGHSDATAADGLPSEVDAALAWTVREGTTNVVRHSRATHVSILVSAGPGTAVAEISNGQGFLLRVVVPLSPQA